MTSIERKLLFQSGLIGAVLTLSLVCADLAGWLASLEQKLHDHRARKCQYYSPLSTTSLLHLDIDDRTLDAMGPWPWPRWKLAHLVDEIRLAGAKALALDVLFQEPSKNVKDDERFAEAVERHGRVLIPISLELQRPQTQVMSKLVAVLTEDLELKWEDAVTKLDESGLDPNESNQMVDVYIRARRKAMRHRIQEEFDRGYTDLAQIKRRLLPGTDPLVTGSPQIRLLENQYRKVNALRMLRRFTGPTNGGLSALPVEANFPPITPLCAAMAMTGVVDYQPDDDGVVRTIPLWVNQNGRLYPQMSLALACMMLGVEPKDIKISKRHLEIVPRSGDTKKRVIPIHSRHHRELDQEVSLLIDIPWFGPSGRWELMYGPQLAHHYPVVKVWEVHETLEKIKRNIRNADDAIKAIYNLMDQSKLKQLQIDPVSLDQIEQRFVKQRIELINQTLEEAEPWLAGFSNMSERDIEAFLKELPDETERHKHKIFLASANALPQLRQHTTHLAEQLANGRRELRIRMADRAVLLGATYTGGVDFKPTSLHAKCPGAVVHGVIFNGIMTGHLLRRPDHWVTLATTLVIGLLATAGATMLSPIRAMLAALTLGGAYWVINGIVLYDYANTIVGAAAPTLTVVLVWSGCTIYKFVIERRERARITRRFSSYVDPALVNYVIEHPKRARLDGQVRELTVVFTDLEGFTSLSEKLQERTVPLLNDYMGRMVPIIRNHHGYVNKFLGDGMMFFFGAPLDNKWHATDAVSTVLEMQRMMLPFNEQLEAQGLPIVNMRVGVSSGDMVVGDAGSTDASDYTVLGDTVNLGSRLESANKYTGTRVMINDRTAELIGDLFLLRPIGRLQVVGKREGVMVYEPICVKQIASHDDHRLVDVTTEMVDLYIASKFNKCLEAIEKMEQTLGSQRLTNLYREQCLHHQANPPENGFDGYIVLTEK